MVLVMQLTGFDKGVAWKSPFKPMFATICLFTIRFLAICLTTVSTQTMSRVLELVGILVAELAPISYRVRYWQ